MSGSPMFTCPKCGNTNIRTEEGRLEGAAGQSRLFFDVYICNNCRYSELYFIERTYLYLGPNRLSCTLRRPKGSIIKFN